LKAGIGSELAWGGVTYTIDMRYLDDELVVLDEAEERREASDDEDIELHRYKLSLPLLLLVAQLLTPLLDRRELVRLKLRLLLSGLIMLFFF
jgi:hypothetical protein